MRGDKLQKTYTLKTNGTSITFLYSEGLLTDQMIEQGARAIAAEIQTGASNLYKPIRRSLKLQFVKVGA